MLLSLKAGKQETCQWQKNTQLSDII